MPYSFDILAAYAAALQESTGLDVRSAVRLPAVQMRRRRAPTFIADLAIVADDNTFVCLIKVASPGSGKVSWTRVRNYLSLGVPVYAVPAGDLPEFAAACKNSAFARPVATWRVSAAGSSRAPF